MQNQEQELTPVEQIGNIYVKRDDLFQIAGVCGGKARTCWYLAQGAKGLVTAGSRMSPQVNIVAHIANYLKIPCRVHVPSGEITPELGEAKYFGAEIVQHNAGYNNVIIARAREDAKVTGWTNIPFGMECQEAIEQTKKQVMNLPKDIQRIVVPVGSGMSLAGILHGLRENNQSFAVVGVRIGADPIKRLDKYAPLFWWETATMINCGVDYHKPVFGELVGNGKCIRLDPIYEAKCLPFVKPGDLLWILGVRATVKK